MALDKYGSPIPNDKLDRPLIIVFDDNPTLVKASDITDVWVRQDKQWINLTPHDRKYDVNLRIMEKSKSLAREEFGKEILEDYSGKKAHEEV